jgi:hypothetical protein
MVLLFALQILIPTTCFCYAPKDFHIFQKMSDPMYVAKDVPISVFSVFVSVTPCLCEPYRNILYNVIVLMDIILSKCR